MTTQGAQGGTPQGAQGGTPQGAQGGTPQEPRPKTRLDTLEERIASAEQLLKAVLETLENLKKLVGSVAKPAGLFGGKRERAAMRDTKTGIVYPSKAALGKALAAEFGLDPADHFAYYKVMGASPEGRLVEASEAEAKAAWNKVDAERQAAVDAANKKLEEEALAAKEKPAVPKPAPAPQSPGPKPGTQPKK